MSATEKQDPRIWYLSFSSISYLAFGILMEIYRMHIHLVYLRWKPAVKQNVFWDSPTTAVAMTASSLASLQQQDDLVYYSRCSWQHPVLQWSDFIIFYMLVYMGLVAYHLNARIQFSSGKGLKKNVKLATVLVVSGLIGCIFKCKGESDYNRCCCAWSDLLYGTGARPSVVRDTGWLPITAALFSLVLPSDHGSSLVWKCLEGFVKLLTP